MIVERIGRHLPSNNMTRYFYFEAPTTIVASKGSRTDSGSDIPNDDEEVKAETQEIKASRGGRTDYNKDIPQDEPTTGADDIESDTPDTQGEDDTGENEDYTKDIPEDEPSDAPDDTNENNDADSSTDEPDNGTAEEEDTGNESEGGPDSTSDEPDDSEDETDGSGDAEESNEEPTNDNEADGTSQSRKYNLYKDFMSLYNSNKSYIEKLERSRASSMESTIVINSALNQLNKIDDILYEYMTIKFPKAPFIDSLIFYHQTVSAIRLCFASIRNNKPFINQTASIEDLK